MTSDETAIRRWFIERPGMNYAVVCDEWHVILDPDTGVAKNGHVKQGEANFRAAEEAAGAGDFSIFDATFRVRTPKGGVHLYFKCDRAYKNSVSTIIPDVDVRGPDGYVVGPGCWTADDPENNTAEGVYQIEVDGEPADLPSWLKAKLDAEGTVGKRAANAGTAAWEVDSASAIAQASAVLKVRKPAIEGQGGDAHTVATAMLLKDYGVSQDKCFELIYHTILFPPTDDFPKGRTWNETCEPPWTESDMQDKVRNAYSYGNRQIGAKMDALAMFDEVAPPAVDGMDAMQEALKPGEHYSAIEQPVGVDPNKKIVDESLFNVEPFLSRNIKFESVINEWLLAEGVTAVLAKRGTGKSVFITDLICRIACDMEWNGIQPAPGWAVVYLCGEDDIGLQRNLAAWKATYGRFPAADRLWIADRVPDLMDMASVKAWAEGIKQRLGGRRAIVVLDTWQRATSTASQSDDKEMQRAIHQAEGLARFLGGPAIVAFHPPKHSEDTIIGSTIIENSTKAILQITSTGANERHVEVIRIKGPGEGHYAKFSIESRYFGKMDDQGNEVSGALPIYKGANGMSPTTIKHERDQELRRAVCALIEHVLPERKKGMSFKDVAGVILHHIMHDPESIVSVYFNRSKHVEEITKQMPYLFSAATPTPIGMGMMVVVESDKLFIRDM